MFQRPPYNAAYKEQGYREGYTQGIADGLSKVNVQYTYHVHAGTAGETANGCYTNPIMKQVISHYEDERYHPTVRDDDGDGEEHCPNCNILVQTGGFGSKTCFNCYVTVKNPVYISVVDYYDLGCGKTEDTIETATIIY